MIRITIKGPQGEGKSTIAHKLARILLDEGRTVMLFQEGVGCCSDNKNPDVVIFENQGELE